LDHITFYKLLYCVYYLDPTYPKHTSQSLELNPTAGSSFSKGNASQYLPQNLGFDPSVGSSSSGVNVDQYPPQNWGSNPTAGFSSSGSYINSTEFNEIYFSKNPSGTYLVSDCTLLIFCDVNNKLI